MYYSTIHTLGQHPNYEEQRNWFSAWADGAVFWQLNTDRCLEIPGWTQTEEDWWPVWLIRRGKPTQHKNLSNLFNSNLQVLQPQLPLPLLLLGSVTPLTMNCLFPSSQQLCRTLASHCFITIKKIRNKVSPSPLDSGLGIDDSGIGIDNFTGKRAHLPPSNLNKHYSRHDSTFVLIVSRECNSKEMD